jgi:hypothetical protein
MKPEGISYKRAVVPLDGSMVAEAIVPFILEIAGPLDMEVVLLRVVAPTPPVVVEGSIHVVVEDVERQRADAEEYLARSPPACGPRVSAPTRRCASAMWWRRFWPARAPQTPI